MLYLRRKFDRAVKGRKQMDIWKEVCKIQPMSWTTFQAVIQNRRLKGLHYKEAVAQWITEQTGEK